MKKSSKKPAVTVKSLRTLEEDVVDDWLTLEGGGARLLLGDDISLYDTEYYSKQEIRELESDVRGELEAMVYAATARLRAFVLNEAHKRAHAAEEQVKYLEGVISKNALQSGWVVVDTTWKRGPLHLDKQGWLCTADAMEVPTVFVSEKDANKAIADTRAYEGGLYAWSQNHFVAVEVKQ